jgi:hypothetical protein
MDDHGPNEPADPHGHHRAHHPRRQVYFVTVEWLDDPHEPSSPELLARTIRHALEHAHNVPPDAAPARFVVRVKTEDVAAEVEGIVEHHHHSHG